MIAASILAALLAAPPEPPAAYAAEIARWREQRLARLRSETGWLTVAGLFWLAPGESTFGSDPEGDVVLPEGAPPRAGLLVRDAGGIFVRPAEGVAMALGGGAVTGTTRLPLDGEALALGRFSLQAIKRGDRFGIRVRDPQNPLRRDFAGLDWFPVDEAYRVEGRFIADPEPRTLEIANVLGQVTDEPTPGVVELALGGRKVRLRPFIEDGDTSQWFYVFKDRTAPRETYGGGRFVYSAPAENGRVVIDFNKAYNPPCAFNPFTTCPLPPRENHLPAAVRAGEKRYRK